MTAMLPHPPSPAPSARGAPGRRHHHHRGRQLRRAGHRLHRYRGFRSHLAPTSGAMACGIPAARAAALVRPERMAVCFAGDACFRMSAQELATARRCRLRVTFVIANNGMFGGIRTHQEMNFPGRVRATAIENPDFALLARAYGLSGETVERTEDFPAAFARARASDGAALLRLRIHPKAIAPRAILRAPRERALAGRGSAEP